MRRKKILKHKLVEILKKKLNVECLLMLKKQENYIKVKYKSQKVIETDLELNYNNKKIPNFEAVVS